MDKEKIFYSVLTAVIQGAINGIVLVLILKLFNLI